MNALKQAVAGYIINPKAVKNCMGVFDAINIFAHHFLTLSDSPLSDFHSSTNSSDVSNHKNAAKATDGSLSDPGRRFEPISRFVNTAVDKITAVKA
jgi:hypothetical protein